MERPFGITFLGGPGVEWTAADIPMHLWVFEKLVRGALLRWFTESLGSSEATG